MSKRSSSWAPVAAALVAPLLCGGALAEPFEDCTGASDTGRCQKAYALWLPPAEGEKTRAQFNLRPASEEDRIAARDDAEAVKWTRLAANPNPGGGMADEIKVRTTRAADGKAILVLVALVLPVNPDVVREVLNDYENMPRFVPDIRAARLISEGAGRKRVEIDGVARLLFLEFPTNTTLDVVNHSDGSVAFDSVAGNLAAHGVVRVHGDGALTRVDYQARITPDFWLPSLIGDFLIGLQIRRQFEGMVAEMHRRASSHQPQGLALYELSS